jgi:hypothetical protein
VDRWQEEGVRVPVMSMHKLTAGEGYRYLTRHVAAEDAGLNASVPLTAYYEASGNPPGRWHGTSSTARYRCSTTASSTSITSPFPITSIEQEPPPQPRQGREVSSRYRNTVAQDPNIRPGSVKHLPEPRCQA